MANYDAKNVRTLVVAGHLASGKTSLVEALLFTAGAIQRMGSVPDGTTVSDYNEDEKARKHSIGASLASVVYNGTKINLIDIPGSVDFVGDLVGGMRVADACLIVVNATGGIEIGTERAFKAARDRGIPCMVFINMVDKEHADFEKCVGDLKKKYGKGCAALFYPIGERQALSAVADLINRSGIESAGEGAKALADDLAEAVAESNDQLLEEYLEKGAIEPAEEVGALKKAIASCSVVPVMCGSATKNVGVKELLDTIVAEAPSPADRPAVEALKGDAGEKIELAPDPNGPFSALVFKTLSDPFLGQISLFKVYSGALSSNGSFYDVTKSVREKAGQLFSLVGKGQVPMGSVLAGDIACAAKLKAASTGDSLSDEKNQIRLPEIQFPEPAISFSLRPKSRADEDKIATALHKIVAEDPTFKVTRDEQTHEMIASGMGDQHISAMINRMKARYGVEVEIGTPKVAYKETILGKGDAQHRHKKQTGGAGQFAEVWLRIEPLERGAGFEFVDEVVGGAIPRPFVVSCEKGIRNALNNGPLAGFPVVDVRAIVYDGKTHPVDSKDIAFQVAARSAFRDSMLKAKPVILEPIMDVDIVVPDQYMGDITGSLNSRRGRVMGMEPNDGNQTIKAKIPLEEMYKYVNELKSITGGRGTYTMSFSHYEVVPSNLAQGIIDKAKASRKQEVEA